MKIAVVIPCYKVKNQILEVVALIPEDVNHIYVVDDCCPVKSGKFVADHVTDSRVHVIYNKKNLGVGGAVKEGYIRALKDECEIVIKLDGDGQMNPSLIPELIKALLRKEADYVKGNRFFYLEDLQAMPGFRLLGNSLLSFISKIVSGYWDVMDPTNGFTAISNKALQKLPLSKIDNRYFFESDMLFRLSTVRAVVADMPMKAVYQDEKSNLSIKKILFQFPPKYLNRFFKRIFYQYFLRDFNIASIELLLGFIFFCFGIGFGFYNWHASLELGKVATSGTVMLSALPIILGFQLLLSALNFDIQNIPKKPLCR